MLDRLLDTFGWVGTLVIGIFALCCVLIVLIVLAMAPVVWVRGWIEDRELRRRAREELAKEDE